MKVVITCGPAVVPIDEVRRLTNFSTGELGVRLANAFVGAGHNVTCFSSAVSTTDLRLDAAVTQRSFLMNEDLARGLADVEAEAVLHAAALADFEVIQITDETGDAVEGAKISSRDGELTLRLRPATKVIHDLRARFPAAVIVGWKYELAGGRDRALAAARRQLEEGGTDACVVNGKAWGTGFGLVVRGTDDGVEEFAGKVGLATGLVRFCEDTWEGRL
ncbi:MAG: phosphopantothenoylcysteine decarboxylase [Chthoniobacterales bacterium]